MTPFGRFALLSCVVNHLSAGGKPSQGSGQFSYSHTTGRYSYDNMPLVQAFSSALPTEMIQAISEGAPFLERAMDRLLEEEGDTFWLPMDQFVAPRNVFELAVAILSKVAFPDGFSNVSGGLAGGEWWVRYEPCLVKYPLHYDSAEVWRQQNRSSAPARSFPVLGTVTYLSDAGGPTVMLDQREDADGNDVPELPLTGTLVYPATNRHVIFQGDAAHGIINEDSDACADSARRITFLINWWRTKPPEPGCQTIPDKVARKLSTKDTKNMVAHMLKEFTKGRLGLASKPESIALLDVDAIPEKNQRRVAMSSNLKKPYSYPIPRKVSRQVYSVQWPQSQVWGPLSVNDLEQQEL